MSIQHTPLWTSPLAVCTDVTDLTVDSQPLSPLQSMEFPMWDTQDLHNIIEELDKTNAESTCNSTPLPPATDTASSPATDTPLTPTTPSPKRQKTQHSWITPNRDDFWIPLVSSSSTQPTLPKGPGYWKLCRWLSPTGWANEWTFVPGRNLDDYGPSAKVFKKTSTSSCS